MSEPTATAAIVQESAIAAKHFQQSAFWGEFKCAHGWSCIQLQDVQVLLRSFRAGFFKATLAYVPMAPFPAENSAQGVATPKAGRELAYIKQVAEFSAQLRPLLPKHTLCVRYDFPLDFATAAERDSYVAGVRDLATLTETPIVKADVDVQPPDTVVLPLLPSEDELLAAMKSKWRYNVRYAAKHGVTVRAVHANSADFDLALDSFYALYETTAKRDGIGLHPKSYYRDLLERGMPAEGASTLITLYIASHEGEDLAAIITLFNADEAVYLYGCSGNNKRNLMPAYLVQWTAICDAKRFGCKVYDFYGIPPTGEKSHPMHGLYLFKTGFGGMEIHRPGSFDMPMSALYRLYVAAERARAFWHKKVIKKLRGR